MTAPHSTPQAAPHAPQTAAQQPRGRPRDERARLAILDAAAELLLDRGLEKVSMDLVAERAGVSKATIYRWWPAKEKLALDAVYRQWSATEPEPRETGSPRDDLVELLDSWSRLARSRPYGLVIAGLVTKAQADPDFAAEYRSRFVAPRRERGRAILTRAVDTGELPAGTDIELGLDLLYGPIYHRLLQGHAPIDESFVRGVVDTVYAGLGAASRRGVSNEH
jgi:AcrR family transcriptional regulator